MFKYLINSELIRYVFIKFMFVGIKFVTYVIKIGFYLFRNIQKNWIKLRRKIIKILFIGRSIYSKYISFFLLAIIVLVLSIVYVGYDFNFDHSVRISKYSGVATANASVLFNPGMQSFVTKTQLKVVQYIVQPGDTLSSIAAKYSPEDRIITVDTIMWANNIDENTKLIPGMKLDIPPVSGVLHVVKKGETIDQIAKMYGLLNDNDVIEKRIGVFQSIVDVNYLAVKVDQQGDKEIRIPEIYVGQRLIIPDGIKKKQISQPLLASIDKVNNPSNSRSISSNLSSISPNLSGLFVWPVENGKGYISQGWRSGHPAIDIADISAPNLVAMADGVIKSFSYYDGYRDSKCSVSVVIAYDNGYESVYCHLSYIAPGLTPGMRVAKGQVVGRMGCTGLCTGTHVHLEIRKIDTKQRINPCSLDIFKGRDYCAGRG